MKEQMNTPLELLQGLSPDPYVLLALLSKGMDGNMLYRIAEADYGYESDYCLEVLERIVKTEKTPRAIKPPVHEVLSLTRWTEAATTREHYSRAFACTILLITNRTNEEAEIIGENDTLAVLLESVTTLGPDFSEAAGQLIAWCLLRDQERQDLDAFMIYALLLLLITNHRPDAELQQVIDWLMTREQHQRLQMGDIAPNPTFLLGLTFHTQRHTTWKKLTRQLIDAYRGEGRVAEDLRLIRECLVDGRK